VYGVAAAGSRAIRVGLVALVGSRLSMAAVGAMLASLVLPIGPLPVGVALAAVSPDAPPLPSPLPADPGASAVTTTTGYLPGSGGVGPDGAYHYSIPLDVPAGRAGMAPRLSLEYSSGGGNGALGVGWSLAGASSRIVRCGRVPASATDGNTRSGVTFSAEDRFCWDGQELVATGVAPGASGTGAYGANNTQYRTESNQFSMFVSEGTNSAGPDRFVVSAKDGRKLVYNAFTGTRTKSGVAFAPDPVTGDIYTSTPRAVWLLGSETDRSGNQIKYSHEKDTTSDTEFDIKMITYTWHVTSGGVTDMTARRYVEFEYESGTAVPSSTHYQAGVPWTQRKRLKTISMFAPNPTETSLAWKYTLGYAKSNTNRSQLTSVQKCGAQGGCLRKKEFGWSNPLSQLPTFTSSGLDGGDEWTYNPPYRMQVMDLNGDGLDDVLYSTGDSGPQHYHRYYVRLGNRGPNKLGPPIRVDGEGDFPSAGLGLVKESSHPFPLTNDGKDAWSAVFNFSAGPSQSFLKWDAANNRFVSAGYAAVPVDSDVLMGKAGVAYGDFNGDGLLDQILPLDSGNGTATYNLRFNSPSGLYGMQVSSVQTKGCKQAVSDTDGDGRSELLVQPTGTDSGTPDQLTCAGGMTKVLVNDAGTLTAVWGSVLAPVPGGGGANATFFNVAPLSEDSVTTHQGDVNGDGLLDSVVVPVDSNKPASVLWNTGFGLKAGASFTLPRDQFTELRMGDINGDGRADIIALDSKVTAYLSNGDATFVSGVLTTDAGLQQGAAHPLTHFGDFNGDGRVDIVRKGKDNPNTQEPMDGPWTVLTQDATISDRMTTVTDQGTNWPRETITYSSEWSYHQESISSNTCGYPTTCVRRGLVVARRVDSRAARFDSSNTAPYSTFYGYEDPVFDVRGRGLVGFGTFWQWDPQRPMESKTTFDNRTVIDGRYPFAGVPASVITNVPILTQAQVAAQKTDPTVRSTQTDYTYEYRPMHGGASYATFPTGSTTWEWEQQATIDWGSLAAPNTHIAHLVGIAKPATVLRRSGASASFDNFGNQQHRTRFTAGGTTEKIDTAFIHDNGAWLIGRPSENDLSEGAITNGDFESTLMGGPDEDISGMFGWAATGAFVTNQAGVARLGSVSTSGDSSITQDFAVPATATSAALSLQYMNYCEGTLSNDWATAMLADRTTGTTTAVLPKTCAKMNGFSTIAASLAAGHSYTLTLTNRDGTANAVTQTSFDNVKLVVSPTAPVVRHTAFETDPGTGLLTKATTEPGNPDSSQTQSVSYGYNGHGVLTAHRVHTDHNAQADRVVHYEYDTAGLTGTASSTPDEEIYASQVWQEHSDASKRPSTWTLVQPAYGILVATEDVNGVQASASYDELGRPTELHADGRPTTTLTYAIRLDLAGGLNGMFITSKTNNVPTTAVLDAIGRTREVDVTGFDGTSKATITSYDALGRAIAVTPPSPSPTVSATYDALDRQLTASAPLTATSQATTTSTYTFSTITTKDPSEHQVVLSFDLDGRLATSKRILAQAGQPDTLVTTGYTYGPFDQPATVTDPAGNKTSYSYDANGRPSQITDPDTGVTSYTYYGTGEVRTAERKGQGGTATGHLTTYGYDDLGRQTQAVNEDGTTRYTWDTAANGIGRMASATSGDGIRTSFRYDDHGRPAGTDYTDQNDRNDITYSVDVGYDPTTARPTTLTYPGPERAGGDRFAIKTNYNPHGYVSTIADATAGGTLGTLWTVNSRYHNGSLDTATLGNGIKEKTTYNPVSGRLAELKATSADGSTIYQDYTYSHYANGQLHTRTEADSSADRTETFGYDTLGRLTSWELANDTLPHITTSYAYDTIDNLTGDNRGYGGGGPNNVGPHALAHTNDHGFAYDKLGRQTTVKDEFGTTLEARTFTAFDLPKTITKAGATTNYKYDAFGNKIIEVGPAGTTFYVPGLFEKRTAPGGATTNIYYLQGTDGRPIGQAVYNGSTTTVEYALANEQGSRTHTLNGTNITQAFYYEPYGQRINANGTPFTGTTGNQTTGYTGHEHDPNHADLINMSGRIYHPGTQAFLTPDPLNAPGDNPYAYTHRDPVNRIDPTGFTDCDPNEQCDTENDGNTGDGTPDLSQPAGLVGPDCSTSGQVCMEIVDPGEGGGTGNANVSGSPGPIDGPATQGATAPATQEAGGLQPSDVFGHPDDGAKAWQGLVELRTILQTLFWHGVTETVMGLVGGKLEDPAVATVPGGVDLVDPMGPTEQTIATGIGIVLAADGVAGVLAPGKGLLLPSARAELPAGNGPGVLRSYPIDPNQPGWAKDLIRDVRGGSEPRPCGDLCAALYKNLDGEATAARTYTPYMTPPEMVERLGLPAGAARPALEGFDGVVQRLRAMGDGSHAAVIGVFPDTTTAHWYNLANRDGAVHVLDAYFGGPGPETLFTENMWVIFSSGPR